MLQFCPWTTGKLLILTQWVDSAENVVTTKKHSDPVKYEILQKNHKCNANYNGSAPNMEVTGAKTMFGRSLKKFNVRYAEYIGDGDSKSFQSIEKAYDNFTVIKKECVGHVQKRMGIRLRNLKKNVKGLGGRGRLTDSIIDRFQNFYGIAIRSNVGDLDKMKKAIYAVLFHVSSSSKNVWHDHCPDGKDSWCKYKRDKALGTALYKPGAGLPIEIVLKYLKPIFLDLSKEELLRKCLHGTTQNQNESFNGCVWRRLPKTQYVGLVQFQLGVYDAVANFNIGEQATLDIYKALGMEPGFFTRKGCSMTNRCRLKVASYKSLKSTKKQRKIIRGLKKRKGDKEKDQEGSTYAPGSF